MLWQKNYRKVFVVLLASDTAITDFPAKRTMLVKYAQRNVYNCAFESATVMIKNDAAATLSSEELRKIKQLLFPSEHGSKI